MIDIQSVAAMEWAMFDQVQNAGGRASCQNNPKTFMIMRESQFQTWSSAMLDSYAKDLHKAQQQGRNLITEKYGYMMESTHPDEFQHIKDQLPPITWASLSKIDDIVLAHIKWERMAHEAYPHLCAKGRPLTADYDSPWVTSFETYLRGELKTYSQETLDLYHEYILKCEQEGRNLALENLHNMVQAYGYSSLEEADTKMNR